MVIDISNFDVGSFGLESLKEVAFYGLNKMTDKKNKRNAIKNEYLTTKDRLTRDTKSFMAETRLKTLAGGVDEQTLSPSLDLMLKRNLEDLRKLKEKELVSIGASKGKNFIEPTPELLVKQRAENYRKNKGVVDKTYMTYENKPNKVEEKRNYQTQSRKP